MDQVEKIDVANGAEVSDFQLITNPNQGAKETRSSGTQEEELLFIELKRENKN